MILKWKVGKNMEFLTDIEKRLLFSAISKERKVCVEIDKEGSPDSIALTPVVDSLSNKFMYDRLFKKIYEQGKADGKKEALETTNGLQPMVKKMLEKERKDTLSEINIGINNIIAEYGINGKVLTSLITSYLKEKQPWIKAMDEFEEEKSLEADYDIDDCYEERE